MNDAMALISIGPDDNGKEIPASVGDMLVIKLPENPTTGVRWAFDLVSGPIESEHDKYEQPEPSKDTEGRGIGAAAIRVLTLRVQGCGRAALRLKRWQEWEGGSSIDATFSCTIRIES